MLQQNLPWRFVFSGKLKQSLVSHGWRLFGHGVPRADLQCQAGSVKILKSSVHLPAWAPLDPTVSHEKAQSTQQITL